MLKDILTGLLEDGHEVFLIQRQWSSGEIPEDLTDYKNFKFYNFPMKDSKGFFGRYMNLCKFFWHTSKLIKKQTNADVTFVGSSSVSWLPILLLRRKKIPSVYNVQDLFPQNAFEIGMISPKGLYGKVLKKLQSYGYSKADRVITISSDMKKMLVDAYHVAEDRVAVIHNWGHLSNENDETFLQMYPKEKDKFRVVYAGNIGKMQNVEILIKACAASKVRDSQEYYILGSGSAMNGLRQLHQRDYSMCDNIFYKEMLPGEHAQSVYQGADVSIIPLAERVIHSALPSKTADCLATERPLIFCIDKDSDFAKALEEHDIPVVSPNDPEGLAQAIQEIQENGWKGRSRELFEKLFNRENNVRQYAEVICSTKRAN